MSTNKDSKDTNAFSSRNSCRQDNILNTKYEDEKRDFIELENLVPSKPHHTARGNE